MSNSCFCCIGSISQSVPRQFPINKLHNSNNGNERTLLHCIGMWVILHKNRCWPLLTNRLVSLTLAEERVGSTAFCVLVPKAETTNTSCRTWAFSTLSKIIITTHAIIKIVHLYRSSQSFRLISNLATKSEIVCIPSDTLMSFFAISTRKNSERVQTSVKGVSHKSNISILAVYHVACVQYPLKIST